MSKTADIKFGHLPIQLAYNHKHHVPVDVGNNLLQWVSEQSEFCWRVNSHEDPEYNSFVINVYHEPTNVGYDVRLDYVLYQLGKLLRKSADIKADCDLGIARANIPYKTTLSHLCDCGVIYIDLDNNKIKIKGMNIEGKDTDRVIQY